MAGHCKTTGWAGPLTRTQGASQPEASTAVQLPSSRPATPLQVLRGHREGTLHLKLCIVFAARETMASEITKDFHVHWQSRVRRWLRDASAATVTPEPGPAPAGPRRTFMVAKVSCRHGTVTPGPEPVVGPRIQVAGHGASDCSDSENLKQLQCQCSHGRDSTGFAHCVTASGPGQRTFA